jgi:hypothetical protein
VDGKSWHSPEVVTHWEGLVIFTIALVYHTVYKIDAINFINLFASSVTTTDAESAGVMKQCRTQNIYKGVRVEVMSKLLCLVVLLVIAIHLQNARHNTANLLCVASHKKRHQVWVEDMFNNNKATRNKTLDGFEIYKTTEVNSKTAKISDDDLSVLGSRCNQVIVIIAASELVYGRNPLSRYDDFTGTEQFLTHPRSKLAIVNATCELMAMDFGDDAEQRKLEKETCLQGSRQKYFEKFYRQFGVYIPKTTPVVDIPPATLLPTNTSILDLLFLTGLGQKQGDL